MTEARTTRVAVNGYGVIGKRVAAAMVRQANMQLAGVSDVVTDWRARVVTRNGFSLFGASTAHANAMRAAGVNVTDALDVLPEQGSQPGNRHFENIDAIRALAGTVRAANESIVRTNTALGIRRHMDVA